MARTYVVQCMYPAADRQGGRHPSHSLYYAAAVAVEADTPEDAFDAAVRKAGEDGLRENTDVAGEPFAWKIREAKAVAEMPRP